MTARATAFVVALGCFAASATARADCPPEAVSCKPGPPITADLADPPLFGEKDGLIFLRDPRDYVRLYPHAELDLDGHGFFHHTTRPTSEQVGADLGAHFLVRHAIFSMSGELFKTFSFDVGVDLVANPAVDGARADGRDTRVALTDAWGAVDAGRGLWLRAGVFAAPYSLENTTRAYDLGLLERTTVTRFVMPGNRLLGAALGGALLHDWMRWDLGAFGLETLTPGEFERIFDGVGRMTIRPTAGPGRNPDEQFSFGASARMGSRNRRDSTSALPAMTTSQGLALWQPTWRDADGTFVHAVGSSTQAAIGGEVRIPTRGFAATGEFNYLTRGAAEIPEGSPQTTLRKGEMHGTASYVQFSVWPLQFGQLVDGYPTVWGAYPKKDHVELASISVPPERNGFELSLLASYLRMHYDGASRGGTPDPDAPPGHIEAAQFSFGATYWQTARFKLGMNLNWYYVPHRSGPNGAVVPGNADPPGDADPRASGVGELAFRVAGRF